MREKIASLSSVNEGPKFIAGERGLYSKNAYIELQKRSEAMAPQDILNLLDAAINDIAKFSTGKARQLKPLQQAVSDILVDGFTQDGLERIDGLIEELQTALSILVNHQSPSLELDQQIKFENCEADLNEVKKMRDALHIKAQFLREKVESEQGPELWDRAEQIDRDKVDELRRGMGIEGKEGVEKQLKRLISAINSGAGKIVSAALPEEIWRKAGRRERLRAGFDIAVDGKPIIGVNPDQSGPLFGEYFDSRFLGAPKSVDIPDVVTLESYLTYRLSETSQPMYERRDQVVEIDVPRVIMGISMGTKKEKRVVMQDVLVGERPALMSDKVSGGDQKRACSLSFRRAGRCYDGRMAEVEITMYIPEEVAKEASDLLQRHPDKADEIFEGVLPTWMKGEDAKLKFDSSKYIYGIGLKNGQEK